MYNKGYQNDIPFLLERNMRVKTIQAKHVNKLHILNFLYHMKGRWACIFKAEGTEEELDNSVWNAIPSDVPYKVGLAAMRQLIKNGFVEGCGCGCRGDFEITEKGEQYMKDEYMKQVQEIFGE